MDTPQFKANVLDWLLSPTSWIEFVEEYWGKKPLLLQRGRPRYYRDLLGNDDLDYVLHAATRRRGAVEILSGGGRSQAAADPEFAVRAVRRGLSLRINALQRFSPTLSSIRAHLEQQLSCHVNMNLYLTPGDGKALGKHYDTHDVLVVQVSGQKRWQLFDGGVPDPLEFLPLLRSESRAYQKRFRLARQSDQVESTTTQAFTLEAGDLLYLPRGYQHAAQGELGTVSCHITIGFQGFTYLDLLSATLANAAANDLPALRRSLPHDYLWNPEAQRAAMQQARDILHALPEVSGQHAALKQLSRLFTRSRDNLVEASLLRPTSLNASASIGAETRLLKRNGIVFGLDQEDAGITLFWRDGTITVPQELEPACLHLIQRGRFRVGALPGPATMEQKIAFARDLVDLGVVRLGRQNEAAPEAQMNVQTNIAKSGSLAGWLPTSYNPDTGRLTWRFSNSAPLAEPFFRQSVRRVEAKYPGKSARQTDLSALPDEGFSPQPAGFIVHVSRCGSTLVSNAMRAVAGVEVVSEADPINEALTAIEAGRMAGSKISHEQAIAALRRLVSFFCQYPARDGSPEQAKTVFKLTSWNILSLAELRRLWPDVPVAVILREPAEVMVSCLAQPPGWMFWQDQPERRGGGRFSPEIAHASKEEFCARMLGQFMQAAIDTCDPLCLVVDYSELDREKLLSIASHLGLSPSAVDAEQLSETLTVYSKDPSSSRTFESDTQQKQASVTEKIRSASRTWAEPVYLTLRGMPQRSPAD